jgi:ribonuclease P protein component
MLPKKHRLSKTAEVKHTASRGRSFFNPFLVIKVTKAEQAKATVIVSTKVSKKAVERNRLKRLTREELRNKMEQLKPGNYALIIKPAAESITGTQLRAEINKALKAGKYLE